MTVLAIRDGIFAADSLVTSGMTRYGQCAKLRRLADGSIIGFAGDLSPGIEMLDYFESTVRRGRKVENKRITKIAGIEGLWLRKSGVFMFSSVPESHTMGLVKLEGSFFAEGSGFVAALSAMHAGASAKLAVEIACEVDTTCGLPVLVLSL